MGALPQPEIDAIMARCAPHMTELYQTGQALVVAGLGLVAKLLRREDGAVLVTDGPFTKSKEMIGGTFPIESKGLEDTMRVARLHPTTRVDVGEHLSWRLELRPIEYFYPPASDTKRS